MRILESTDSRLATPKTRRYVEQLMGEVETGKKRMEEAIEESLNLYDSCLKTSNMLMASALLSFQS